MALYYNAGDPRAPDILVTPNIGVTYSNSGKKLAEHGGFAHDDINVMMLLSNPSFKSATVSSPVETSAGCADDPSGAGTRSDALQAVQKEGTQVLPGVQLRAGD